MEESWVLLAEIRPSGGGGFGEADHPTADRLDTTLRRAGCSSDDLRFRYILGPGYPLMRIETRCEQIVTAWRSLEGATG